MNYQKKLYIYFECITGPIKKVYVYDTYNKKYSVKAQTLPMPIYEHNCIKTVSQKDGRPIILLAGGNIEGGKPLVRL